MEEDAQSGVQSWTWPERKMTGIESSTASQPDQGTAPSGLASQPPQDWTPQQIPGEGDTSFRIRSAIVVAVASIITTMVTFGVNITNEQAVALIGLVTTLSSLVTLVVGGRRGRG